MMLRSSRHALMYLGSTIFTDSPLLAREVAEPHLDDLALLRNHGVAYRPQGVELGARRELRQLLDRHCFVVLPAQEVTAARLLM